MSDDINKQIIERDDDEGEVVEFKVRVDLASVAWLCEMADANGQPPAVIMAALIKSIREDDEVAHQIEPPPDRTPSAGNVNLH